MSANELPPLIEALRESARYPDSAARVELVETHISWVLLTGEFAYKIKKPVNLGFLDFSTLQARRHYCEEELRLNRRTAPELYVAVVPITGTPREPEIAGAGAAIEYAVKMRQFDQDRLLDRVAKRGELAAGEVDALAQAVAGFHSRIDAAPAASEFGNPGHVLAPAMQNFEQLDSLLGGAEDLAASSELRNWTRSSYAALAGFIARRKREGYVRECHGDLHLGNIALLQGRPVPFDCIEFNEELRWIDVMSEIAFLIMDLHDHRLSGLAASCLNAYLEATGDYAGLRVLRFYSVYRAMVRAKIACIRAHQGGLDALQTARLLEEMRGYLALARKLALSGRRALVITHGLSGSGKTTVASLIAEAGGAVRIRSDVERKRLHGMAPDARMRAAPDEGLYSASATRATYERLAALALDILDADYPVIVDAAFLRFEERERFRAIARERRVPYVIAACTAPDAVLRSRVAARERAGTDASEATLAVLERQFEGSEKLQAEELPHAVAFDTGADAGSLSAAIKAVTGAFPAP